MIKTKIHEPKRFDWSRLPLQLFRGPEMSFPLSMEIIVAPSFNALVSNAVQCFSEDFTGHTILDIEYDGFPLKIENTTLDSEGNVYTLKENSFGLCMKYICGTEKVVILSLTDGKDLVTWH